MAKKPDPLFTNHKFALPMHFQNYYPQKFILIHRKINTFKYNIIFVNTIFIFNIKILTSGTNFTIKSKVILKFCAFGSVKSK